MGHLLRFWPAAFLGSECKNKPKLTWLILASFSVGSDLTGGRMEMQVEHIWVQWVTLMLRMAQLLFSMETKISIYLASVVALCSIGFGVWVF